MKPCVTIIVPIYNAQPTLRRCVDSVLSQEFADFELILADDGSKDGSGAVCDEFARRDSRVRVVHKANSGVSDTRNQAMALARGEYLQFLDADDWITPNATKLLVRAAREHGCDLVISDFYRVVGERVAPKGDIDEDGPLTREEFAAYMMENPADFYYGVLWNKLYRRDIITEHRLQMDPEISWCEDFLFNLEYIRHARRFFALQVPIYYYVKTKGSLASQGMSISKTVRTKLMLFEYYNEFYKTVLDEGEYEKRRLKVYRFLIEAAQDGSAPPLPLVSTRLGEERTRIRSGALEGEGLPYDALRERKLLDYYLEPAAQKNGLSLAEANLLLRLRQWDGGARRELAEFAGVSGGSLPVLLQRLAGKGLVSTGETREPGGREKRMSVSFPPASGTALADVEKAWEDFEAARLSGFAPEEREEYARLTRRIQDNIRDILQ